MKKDDRTFDIPRKYPRGIQNEWVFTMHFPSGRHPSKEAQLRGNVVWHDDSGSLASIFCLKFIQASEDEKNPIIYVTFDRSPKNLIDKLGQLARSASFIIVDCFSHGKGASSPVFLRTYEDLPSHPCRIIQVEKPKNADKLLNILNDLHRQLGDNLRFVFESLTGMQELWGGEEHVVNFYSQSCPQLTKMNTVAYWLMEKRAHSPRLRTMISQIAQVVVELSVKRGMNSLVILKADNRDTEVLHKPINYWAKEMDISFDRDGKTRGVPDLGLRIKELRAKRGLSQTELARRVGLTPSTISQVESNLIYPSLPALFKMAEVLSIGVGSFFQDPRSKKRKVVFPASEAHEVKLANIPDESLDIKLLTPVDFDSRLESYMIEFPPRQTISCHFFMHKGEEIGFLISGELQVKLEKEIHNLSAGDVIYLASEVPAQWKNNRNNTAKLLWVRVNMILSLMRWTYLKPKPKTLKTSWTLQPFRRCSLADKSSG